MPQENLFSQNFQPPQPQHIFDPNTGLYQADMPLQFAASVPHRQPQHSSTPPQRQQGPPHQPLAFQHAPFQNPEVMMPPSCLTNYPSSPFERQEPLMPTGGGSTSRQVQTKAERRAEHNATERLRRENLNAKFQQLAHILPNLQNDTRHSKSAIIDRTLDYVKGSILKEERMQNRIKELEKINSYLLSQLDDRSTGTSYKRKKSTQIEPSPSPVPASSPSPNSVISEELNHMEDPIAEQPPIIHKQGLQNNKTSGFFGEPHVSSTVTNHSTPNTTTTVRAPSNDNNNNNNSNARSVSPLSATVTPRTAYHVNSNWPNNNNGFMNNQHPIKQEQMLYCDIERLCTMMTTDPFMRYRDEEDSNGNHSPPMNTFVEQQQRQYISMINHSQPIMNHNEHLYHLMQRQ
ncbi:hypothetical protein BCV72DRAFT_204590 [Rhizopus microsporus var. microsporus]|nr:hypothetical protein BCV72DRAFT_204590 [Rhizopus microsporus var. microsporus]